MVAWIKALFANAWFKAIVLPEITGFIKARLDAGQPMPTDDEIVAKLDADADAVIAKGETWLAANPPTAGT